MPKYYYPDYFVVNRSDLLIKELTEEIHYNERFCFIDLDSILSWLFESLRYNLETGYLIYNNSPTVSNVSQSLYDLLVEEFCPVGENNFIYKEDFDFLNYITSKISNEIVKLLDNEGAFAIRYFPYDYHGLSSTRQIVLRKIK